MTVPSTFLNKDSVFLGSGSDIFGLERGDSYID